jgi:Tfp pilus assembly protein PilP
MRRDDVRAARAKTGGRRRGEEGKLAMPTITFKTCGVIVAMLLASSTLLAQGAAPAQPGKPATPATPATAAPTTPGAAAQPAQSTPEAYTYDADGRRDPFVSLVARGFEPSTGKKSEGLGGLTTAELVVKGVMQSRNSYIALVSGPDGKTYQAHVNDRLVDGTIRSVTPQGLVIVQEVNDPLSLVKQREVRKGLRASEDGK